MSSQLRVDNILPSAGTALGIGTASGSITFNSSNISGDVIFNDDVTVNGVLTYEDVTNIDSVGIVTARSGLQVTGGRLLVGNTSSIASLADSKIEAVSGAGAEIHLARNDSSVTDGNAIGILRFYGNDGGTYQECARINCQADGTHADGDKPSRLTFFTTPSGAQTSAERLRITSAGRIGINQVAPEAMLQVDYDEGNSEVGIRLRAYNASGSKTWQLSEVNGNAGVFTIKNATNSQDILNIDGVNQRVGVNDTTPDATLSVGGSTAFIDVGAAGGNRGKIGYSSNNLYFGTSSSSGEFIFKNNVTSTDNPASSGTERVRIDSNGRQYHYTDGSLRMHLNATGLGVNTQTITGGRLIHAHNTGTGSAYFQSTNSSTGEGSNSGALYGVSGTTCYAPWNYINGPVVFATNASEKMRIHATGEVTKSSQPLAIIGTTQNNYTPSTGDVLPFNYNNTNRGNHYNTSNYTFTCPVAGDYMVILRLSRKGWCGDLELAKNNSQYVRLELRETGRNSSSAADWQAWCYDFIVPCAANDTLKWKAASTNTGTGGGNYLLDGYNHIYYDSVTYYLMG
jgi:hypothetical protein